jgi:hypothetical protein
MTKITIQELKKRFADLKPGDSGVIVSSRELEGLEIPSLPLSDLKARAEWLCGKLPIPCGIKESSTTGAWVFTPKNSN